MTLTYGSEFSGIGGFDLAFDRAGMTCLWQCEIDPKAREVLTRHLHKPIIEDVRDVTKDTAPAVDVLVGGFPCQDVSVAGKREGLDGERSGLWFEFRRTIEELRPRWVVIENVPGLLSSHKGRDFATILQGLVKLGYGVCWRILDAQFFGVPQRRRRLFIVGSLGTGRSAEVLFEREGMRWDPPSRSEAGKDPATYAVRSAQTGSNGWGVAEEVSGTLDNTGGWNITSPALRAEGHDASEDGRGRRALIPVAIPIDTRNALRTTDKSEMNRQGVGVGEDGDPSPTLTDAFIPAVAHAVRTPTGGIDREDSHTLIAFGGNNTSGPIDIATAQLAHHSTFRGDFESETFLTQEPVAFTERTRKDGLAVESQEDLAYALLNPGDGGRPKDRQIAGSFGVRRLTPTECARLQGFPDDWNDWLSDSARYKQFGNAVCVPVAYWIAKRIMALEAE